MLLFILTIMLIYILYYIWIVINFNKKGEPRRKTKKDAKKMPSEVEYFVVKYKVDLSKINYRYFLQLVGLMISVDLAIVITIISLIKIVWLQLLIGVILVIFVCLMSFHILGKYFNKKGLTFNEDNKRNRK